MTESWDLDPTIQEPDLFADYPLPRAEARDFNDFLEFLSTMYQIAPQRPVRAVVVLRVPIRHSLGNVGYDMESQRAAAASLAEAGFPFEPIERDGIRILDVISMPQVGNASAEAFRDRGVPSSRDLAGLPGGAVVVEGLPGVLLRLTYQPAVIHCNPTRP